MKKSRLEQNFEAAVEHHQAGRYPLAETLYREVLAKEPNHADALHLLGVMAAQLCRFDDAAGLIGKSVVLCPNIPEYRAHYGNVLSEKKEYHQAIEQYRQA